jgi:ribosomal protein L29
MKDLLKKNKKDLIEMLKTKREALRAFNFSLVGGKTRNVKEGSAIKREIARILTVLNTKTTEAKENNK